ncbi:TPA_asm: maturation protein [ssRNA phage Gerhypos.2_24]|uniref:Maturation protein n=2 Tax=Leviviricetes TaxID=2842243 RepID=A0A8S5KYM8_9VIRU|nr:maturation protein [ssRNA phage Gerhypos.2_24]QDH87774.1 MAG: hypothetical protein H2Bulk35360_000001 [Leviviridae sp.]DAD50291.1 TPA_asm: maturation protein [ssRNA phage Gerhypos.2_24]
MNTKHIQLTWSSHFGTGSPPYRKRFRKEALAGGGYRLIEEDLQFIGDQGFVTDAIIQTDTAPTYMHECFHAAVSRIQDQPLSTVQIEDDLIGNPAYVVCAQPLFHELSESLPPIQNVFPISIDETNLGLWTYCEDLAAKQVRRAPVPTDTGFNLVTFLREARELKGLVKHIMQYKIVLKKLIRVFRPNGTKLRDVLRIIAEEHLTWAFGILPLISDLESIMRILAKHENTIKNIVEGHKSTFRYGKGLITSGSIPLPADIGNIGKYRGVGGDWDVTYQWDVKPEWKGYYTYFIRAAPHVKRPYGGFLLLLQSLGVQPDPAILWDAIPFSFVVDWILDVGEVLHSAKIDWVPLTMHITDAAHHVRAELARRYWYTDPISGIRTPLLAERMSVFQRRRFLPEHATKQALKELGVTQLLLSASLAASR